MLTPRRLFRSAKIVTIISFLINVMATGVYVDKRNWILAGTSSLMVSALVVWYVFIRAFELYANYMAIKLDHDVKQYEEPEQTH